VLHKLADSVDPPKGRRFDWTKLHELLARIPGGKWTTYGDLATAVGTA
jgi:alkylated DNA nucleotide flippase Atl1